MRVDAVREEVLQEKRRVTGDLRAVRRAAVATQEPGLVVEFLVREGDEVAAGDVLARLDSRRLELELGVLASQRLVSEALLTEREEDLAQKQRDLDALIQLASNEAANPKELADARTALAASRARIEWARQEILVLDARRALLEDRLEDTRIAAPFAGVVTALHAELGEWLDAGAAALELVSSHELEAWLDVPQRDYAAVRAHPGAIRVAVDATGAVLEVEDYRLIAEVGVEARTFTLIASLPEDPSLAPGMSVTAEVPTARSAPHLTVANDAILRNEVGPFVYFAAPGGEGQPHQALPVPIEILFRTRERAVVRSAGLRAGADVVVEGNERLYPTAPILPVRADARGEGSDGSRGSGGSGAPAEGAEGR